MTAKPVNTWYNVDWSDQAVPLPRPGAYFIDMTPYHERAALDRAHARDVRRRNRLEDRWRRKGIELEVRPWTLRVAP